MNLVRHLAPLLAILPALAIAADEPRPPASGPTELRLKVGEAVELCQTGTVVCPAVAPVCDDPSLVEFELTGAGLRFRGARPGETLCSVRNSGGLGTRWIYRVTVEAK